MEQSRTIGSCYIQDFFYLLICQVALFRKFYFWFKPNFAKLFCSSFADMNMSSVLIIISVIEQKVPYYLCSYI